MATEVSSGNTTLLQSQVANLLVQPLEQASSFLSAGPQIIDSSDSVRVCPHRQRCYRRFRG